MQQGLYVSHPFRWQQEVRERQSKQPPCAIEVVHNLVCSLENGVPGQGTVIPSPDEEASVKRSNRFIHTCGGIEVMPAVREVAPGSVRVTPAVYSTATAAVLLYGCPLNHLQLRYHVLRNVHFKYIQNFWYDVAGKGDFTAYVIYLVVFVV